MDWLSTTWTETSTSSTMNTTTVYLDIVQCTDLSVNFATAGANNRVYAITMAMGFNLLQLTAAIAILTCLNKSRRAHSALAPIKACGEKRKGTLVDWFREAYRIDMEDISIDGQVVVRLCVLGFRFSAVGTFLACFLVPFYRLAGGSTSGSILDYSISNLIYGRDKHLWFVIVVAYIVTAVFVWLMRAEWQHFIRMRHRHFRRRARGELGASACQAQHSLMVERVPRKKQSDAEVRKYFNKVFENMHSVLLQRDTLALYHLKALKGWSASLCGACACAQRHVDRQFDRIVRLERAIAQHGRKVGETMEGLVMDGDAQGLGAVLEFNSVGRAASGEDDQGEVWRAPTSTAFVTLQRASERVISEQAILFRTGDGKDEIEGKTKDDEWVVFPGPESRDIVWANAGIPLSQVLWRTKLGSGICAWGVLCWAVPVTAIQAVSSEQQLHHCCMRAQEFMHRHLGPLYVFLIGYLPVLALMALLVVLPSALRLLATYLEQRKTRTEIARTVFVRNVSFQFFTLWVTVFSSSLLQSAQQILHYPACIYRILGNAIPSVAVYFIMFVIARIGVSLPMLLFPIPSLLSVARGQKPNPVYCAFETEATDIVIVFVLGSMYCLVAPVIMPICMIYFALAIGVYKWLFVNVYSNQFDLQGELWYHIFLGLMLGMLFGMLSVAGLAVIYTDSESPQFYAAMAIPLILLVFGADCFIRLGRLASTMPYEDAVAIDRDPDSAATCAGFSAAYYRDPILDKSVEDLIAEAEAFPRGQDESEEEEEEEDEDRSTDGESTDDAMAGIEALSPGIARRAACRANGL